MKAPEVSVLMSCFNAERWLGVAIESVLSQSYVNYEFIIVNDGSQDRTPDIVRAYSAKDERIVILDKGHTGLTDSLNCGLEIARGHWIARLDADDLCEPGRLERQFAFVVRHPRVVLLGSACSEIAAGGELIRSHRYPRRHRSLVRRLERCGAFFPHSSAFFSAAAAANLGGYRAEFVLCEDLDFWLRLSEEGELACLPDTLVKIRRHSGQITLGDVESRFMNRAYASIVSYSLRRYWNVDPVGIAVNADERWRSFFAWVEERLRKEAVAEQRDIWSRARSAYFSQPNRVLGALQFARQVFGSGHACRLLVERAFGSGRPKRLARDWIKSNPLGQPVDAWDEARARDVKRGAGGP
jgi:glycosyltransferase involved in cell wall biosynthesis